MTLSPYLVRRVDDTAGRKPCSTNLVLGHRSSNIEKRALRLSPNATLCEQRADELTTGLKLRYAVSELG